MNIGDNEKMQMGNLMLIGVLMFLFSVGINADSKIMLLKWFMMVVGGVLILLSLSGIIGFKVSPVSVIVSTGKGILDFIKSIPLLIALLCKSFRDSFRCQSVPRLFCEVVVSMMSLAGLIFMPIVKISSNLAGVLFDGGVGENISVYIIHSFIKSVESNWLGALVSNVLFKTIDRRLVAIIIISLVILIMLCACIAGMIYKCKGIYNLTNAAIGISSLWSLIVIASVNLYTSRLANKFILDLVSLDIKVRVTCEGMVFIAINVILLGLITNDILVLQKKKMK